jgi:hypothetical protein
MKTYISQHIINTIILRETHAGPPIYFELAKQDEQTTINELSPLNWKCGLVFIVAWNVTSSEWRFSVLKLATPFISFDNVSIFDRIITIDETSEFSSKYYPLNFKLEDLENSRFAKNKKSRHSQKYYNLNDQLFEVYHPPESLEQQLQAIHLFVNEIINFNIDPVVTPMQNFEELLSI